MSEGIPTIESTVYSYLLRYADLLPDRWKRWLAIYYPDARIRKAFWRKTCVEMGEGTFPNLGMIVSDDYASKEVLLSIGDRVSIAPGVVFVPYSMPNNSKEMQAHPYVAGRLVKKARIVVGNDVWIGAHVTILPGVLVGDFSVIGSGAVVTADVPPYSIVAGVPAKVIRTLEASGGERDHLAATAQAGPQGRASGPGTRDEAAAAAGT